MTWIKICGTTNADDAHAAVEAGADAIGFVFAPSERQVTGEQAASISATLPPKIERVGVFVNESPARVRELVKQVGLTRVQLQGDETPDYVRSLFSAATPDCSARVVKTLSVTPFLAGALRAFGTDSIVDAILLDSGNAHERGGTGRTFDWSLAAPIVAKSRVRIIVAGGLNAENVARAMKLLHPWGVDAVSGTESAPGKKDPAKIRNFIAAVRQADKNR